GCARLEVAWFEDKGPAFAVHYRSVPERFQPAFCSGVRRRFAGEPARARLLHGKKVFDVLPAIHRDKSSALWDWIEKGSDVALFYFGDDANDEPVYPAVRDHGGVSVAVGRWSSQAEYGVSSPGHVTWFLEWLAREWVDARSGAPMLVSHSAADTDREPQPEPALVNEGNGQHPM